MTDLLICSHFREGKTPPSYSRINMVSKCCISAKESEKLQNISIKPNKEENNKCRSYRVNALLYMYLLGANSFL